jgi:hypothetical protein
VIYKGDNDMAKKRKGYAAQVQDLESGGDLEENIEKTYVEEEPNEPAPAPKKPKPPKRLAKAMVGKYLKRIARQRWYGEKTSIRTPEEEAELQRTLKTRRAARRR